jgi:hypothetical protein
MNPCRAGGCESLEDLLLQVSGRFLGLLGLLLERVDTFELQEAEVRNPGSLNPTEKLKNLKFKITSLLMDRQRLKLHVHELSSSFRVFRLKKIS